jgi:hypothetical protein
VVPPGQLCSKLLHNWLLRSGLGKRSPIYFRLPGADAFDTGKLRLQVLRQPVDDLRTPPFRLLPAEVVAANRPVKKEQIPVYREGSAQPRAVDPVLQLF